MTPEELDELERELSKYVAESDEDEPYLCPRCRAHVAVDHEGDPDFCGICDLCTREFRDWAFVRLPALLSTAREAERLRERSDSDGAFTTEVLRAEQEARAALEERLRAAPHLSRGRGLGR